MIKIDTDKLQEGYVLHGRGTTAFAKAIRAVLNLKADKTFPCWGNHDGLIIKDRCSEAFVIGESVSPFAKLTSLQYYEKMVNGGQYEIKIYQVLGATPESGSKAAMFWIEHVNNTPYDWFGIFKLLWKYVSIRLGQKNVGWEWAHWCTEGVAEAWREGGKIDAWTKINPTPYTTEKRAREGFLKDVTAEVIVNADA